MLTPRPSTVACKKLEPRQLIAPPLAGSTASCYRTSIHPINIPTSRKLLAPRSAPLNPTRPPPGRAVSTACVGHPNAPRQPSTAPASAPRHTRRAPTPAGLASGSTVATSALPLRSTPPSCSVSRREGRIGSARTRVGREVRELFRAALAGPEDRWCDHAVSFRMARTCRDV